MISQLANIDVLILTGGKGERLKSVVNDKPKTMVEINHSPFLVNHINYLNEQGFTRIILCTGYKGDYIKEYFTEYPSENEIIISHEENILGTGGAIKHAKYFIKSDYFIVLNGDSFCKLDYISFTRCHVDKASDITIVVSKAISKSDFGTVHFDAEHRITSFLEKNESINPDYVNAGIYCFNKEMVELMPSLKCFSIEKEYFPSVLNRCVFAYITSQPFFDIGTPERLKLFTQKEK